jgi:cephalosporin hydroxylase
LKPEREEVIAAFRRLYFEGPEGQGRARHRTFWRGVLKCPLDPWACQEILPEVKPDLVVETGTHKGGSALFLADMLELVGRGEVIT